MSQKNIFPQIDDDFFKKGKLGLQLWEITLAVLCWLVLLIPFIWLFMTLYSPFNWQSLHFFHFNAEIDTFHLLSWFLGASFTVILVHHVTMSMRVNRFIKKMSNGKDEQTQYRIALRSKRFDDIFDERFGSKNFRHNVKYFNVDSDKNFDKKYLFNNLRAEEKEK